MEVRLNTPVSGEAAALRAMFAARKQVFIDRLKWDLPVLAGQYEVDQFDTEAAEYLILVDADGRHRASARLLRTDGPHILRDLYPFLCAGQVPAGPSVREITRFCLDPHQTTRERRVARNQLVTALAEHALASGISVYTGVADLAWFRQIELFGWDCRALGQPMRIDTHELVALRIAIDAATLPGLRAGHTYQAPVHRLANALGDGA